MHSSLAIAALLATAALAKPVQKKRDLVVVTETDVVYQYVYVTATADAAAPAATDAPTTTVDPVVASTSSAAARVQNNNGGGRRKHTTTTPVASIAPIAPTSTAETSAAPAPTTVQTVPVAQPTSQAPTTTTKQQTSSAASAPSGTATTYQEAVLLHHNLHRANHSAVDIQWSDNLASIANQWASQCNYQHNTALGGGGYGQNIAAGADPSAITQVITDMMYNSEMPWYAGQYGLDNPDFTNFEHWGHFSQIVWKGTTQVGCATVNCPNGLANTGSGISPWMTVCNYLPAGNMGGEYGTNIGQPLGQATISGSYEVSLS